MYWPNLHRLLHMTYCPSRCFRQQAGRRTHREESLLLCFLNLRVTQLRKIFFKSGNLQQIYCKLSINVMPSCATELFLVEIFNVNKWMSWLFFL